MIEHYWRTLPDRFEQVTLDYFVVMPNHVHGIIILSGNSVGNAQCGIPLFTIGSGSTSEANDHAGSSLQKSTISDVIHWFKTMTTNAYIRGVKESNWQRFPQKLWQRSYYDHIIRNEIDMNRIQNYIINNPSKWAEDSLFTE